MPITNCFNDYYDYYVLSGVCLSVCLSVSVSLHSNGYFIPGGPGLASTRLYILEFVGAKDDAGSGDNRSYDTCKAAIKLSLPTNQHPAFYGSDALPVMRLAV